MEEGGDNEQEQLRREREGARGRQRVAKHHDTGMLGKGEQEGERAAPARFDFAGWVRNNSANYYSALIHVDRYVAPDLYIAWL